MTGPPPALATRPPLDPRAERSRAALRDTLLAMLDDMPLEDVTVVALTRRAGVGYATFFRQYADIAAVLEEIADRLIVELAASVLPLSFDDRHDAIALAIAAFVDARRGALRALLVSAGALVQRAIVARAVGVARAGRAHIDGDLPIDVGATHAVVSALVVLTWWLRDAPHLNANEIAPLLDRLSLAPVAQIRPTIEKGFR